MEIQLWREILSPYEQAVTELVEKFQHLSLEHRDCILPSNRSQDV